MADDQGRDKSNYLAVPNIVVASVLALLVALVSYGANVLNDHSKLLAAFAERDIATVARIQLLERFGPGTGGRFTAEDAGKLRSELRSDFATFRSDTTSTVSRLQAEVNAHTRERWHYGAGQRMERMERDIKTCLDLSHGKQNSQ